MNDPKHKWTDGDNLIAYYLYRFGEKGFPVTKLDLADAMGMSIASLNFKIGNFKAIEGRGGFAGYSQQAVRIYNRYHAATDAEITAAATQAALEATEARLKKLSYTSNEERS